MKYFIGIITVVVFVVCSVYAYGRLRNLNGDIEVEHLVQYPGAQFTGDVRFAAYNIAHGRGSKLGQSNSEGLPEDKITRLQQIGAFLKAENTDIVVLNEVDFYTKWGGYIDQASVIAEAGEFPYIARQNNYDILLPGYSLQFGNAVLSRYPIQSARREALPPLSVLEAWFGGNHDVIDTVIQLNEDQTVRLWGLHLEVRDEAVRIESVQQILAQMRDDEPTVLAGDLNSRPLSNNEPSAFTTLMNSGKFGVYPTVESETYTFPSEDPNRTIDWVLYSAEWNYVSGRVPEVALSDHLPVVVNLQLSSE